MPVDGDRVVEAFVTLDELLDRDGLRALGAERAECRVELGAVVDPGRVKGAGARTWLEDERIADRLGERVDLVGVARGG